ncbi:serine/threonine-protein phosphatase [Nostocoides sp. F2B08]|uniref:PP2C family protein-serine/threonine phosphatase n=1 Tax=Nostocoides sp. F2B08 TaxID=2653936 RepID=UPI0012639825|nr:protein phosphatase 2C domain-containing protein [Tetrasphaera sp. F2B08]KAB7745516.1 serine/threonine-protein phosphatase [Tetrasphaera sp. F2B08]
MSVAGTTVEVGARTAVGRVREHNEDAYLVRDRVFAVADGMGGHAAGEVASALAIEAMDRLSEHDPITPELVVAAVSDANASIIEAGLAERRRRGMGTTLTGVALIGPASARRWLVFNLGDSRVYRFADGRLDQLTVDHSEVQELVDAGYITRTEAAIHPARNIITRSLGLELDPEPDVWDRDPSGEETFLVCSDGLTGELRDAEIARILADAPSAQAAADLLCAAAEDAGGRDNITVVVVRAVTAGD